VASPSTLTSRQLARRVGAGVIIGVVGAGVETAGVGLGATVVGAGVGLGAVVVGAGVPCC
jgi:hypothetical protein